MTTAPEAIKQVLEPLGFPVLLGRLPDHTGKPQYAVFVERVEPQGTARQRKWFLSIYCLTAKTDPPDADVDLEGLLGKALDALDKAQPLNWTEAERGTANDVFNSFKITVWVIMREE